MLRSGLDEPFFTFDTIIMASVVRQSPDETIKPMSSMQNQPRTATKVIRIEQLVRRLLDQESATLLFSVFYLFKLFNLFNLFDLRIRPSIRFNRKS